MASCNVASPSVSLCEGLVYSDDWCSPHEGPFTALAKLARFNVMDSRALCRELFGRRTAIASPRGRHGRSLVDGGWMRPVATGAHALSRVVAARTLDQISDRWGTQIASDDRLRYCPSCLAGGFQSVLCQISGLSHCPAHGDRLLDSCPWCGTATPRYAISADAFDVPLHCTHCARAYSAAWELTSLATPWSSPSGVQAYADLEAWLRRVELLDIRWPDLGSWLEDRTQPEAALLRRRAVWQALSEVAPRLQFGLAGVSLGAKSSASAREHRSGEFDVRLTPSSASRVAIYKSIRRHATRRMNWQRLTFTMNDDFVGQWPQGALAPTHRDVPAEAHGVLLWRHRFEEDLPTALLRWTRKHDLTLRHGMLSWPIAWVVPDALWGHFVLSCLREDQWTAREWHRRTAGLVGWEGGRERAQWMALLNDWLPRMSPLLQLWPCALTQLAVCSERSCGDLTVWLMWLQREGEREMKLIAGA